MIDDILPDVLESGLRVVFCGTQAGAVSARRGAYYSGPGNKFWPVLHQTGLVPVRLVPEDFRTLLRYRIGLTDVAKRTSGPDSALRGGHFDVAGFTTRIAASRPRIIAFNGKRAAQAVLGVREGRLAYGLQAVKLDDADVYVLPSTSGAAAGFWSIEPWKQLAMAVTGTTTR